ARLPGHDARRRPIRVAPALRGLRAAPLPGHAHGGSARPRLARDRGPDRVRHVRLAAHEPERRGVRGELLPPHEARVLMDTARESTLRVAALTALLAAALAVRAEGAGAQIPYRVVDDDTQVASIDFRFPEGQSF